MITFFNREQVYGGMDMNEFSRIRSVLEENRISYRYRVRDKMTQWAGNGTLRGRLGSLGQQFCPEYEIYVHRKDAQEARRLLRKTQAR